jgi:hypothetical protein
MRFSTDGVTCVDASIPFLQVLQNLLQNAVRYSPNGGKIEVIVLPFVGSFSPCGAKKNLQKKKSTMLPFVLSELEATS